MKIKPLLRGPIALRLFIFNALLLFVPVAGFLSFEAYETALLNNLEHALVQEGRALAAWLGESPLDEERAKRIVASLEQRHTSRIRILSKEGTLLADSSVIDLPEVISQIDVDDTSSDIASSSENPELEVSPQETFLYRFLSIPVRVYRKYVVPPRMIQGADYYSGKKQFDGQEIQTALNGNYGSTTRISSGGQTSIILYSALPIFLQDEVEGVVLVSQSTFRILNDLYALRLGVGRVFLFSLVIAVIVSFIMAFTISRPLSRLTREAKNFRMSGAAKRFSGSSRKDEIDTLANAFSELVDKLEQRITWAERFSVDAAHELKNPLAGIKANAELLETSDASQQGIISSIENACSRMEKTISGLRALALLERNTGTSSAEQFGIVLHEESSRYASPSVIFTNSAASDSRYNRLIVHVHVQNLEAAARNLFENAHSFSPKESPIKAELLIHEECLELHVKDNGEGIPDELREKIFQRFYTSRRGSSSGGHSGLGLALVLAIAESGGGTVSVTNNAESSGACFIVSLPYHLVS
jgi:two-component system sensor histidine kinase ChvG